MLRRCDRVSGHNALPLVWRQRPFCFVCQTVRLVSDRASPVSCASSPSYQSSLSANPHRPHSDSNPTHDLFARSRRLHAKEIGRCGGYAAQLTGPALSPTPRTAVHLYSNKENASCEYAEDRYYGARRLRELWRRLSRDRGVRYYVLGTVLLMILATAKLWSLQNSLIHCNGLLGPKKKSYASRLTIVLDVDETIVSYGDKAHRLRAGMVTRPYLAELLDYCAHIDAEVVLWSACSERYMRKVLGIIDPDGIRVSHYITRSSAWFSKDSYYEKNLLWLKRDMADTLMVENRALSVRNCNANAVLVEDFIRGEYMDTGQDFPANDAALLTVRRMIEDLEETGMAVPEYLALASAAGMGKLLSQEQKQQERNVREAKSTRSWWGMGPRRSVAKVAEMDDAAESESAAKENNSNSGDDASADTMVFHADIRSIPCHLAIRQLPDELARGAFYFIGNKYKTSSQANTMIG